MITKKLIVSAVVFSMLAIPAFAADVTTSTGVGVNANKGLNAVVNSNASASSKSETQEQNQKTRSDTEISNRVSVLQKLSDRINAMKLLSSDTKGTLSSQITAQINDLNNLQTKIDADTDETVLKTDVQSITGTYRIYMLVVPQLAILSAADRLSVVASDLNTINAKLNTRIAEAQSAGKDVDSIQATLSDMDSKTSDISVQASAATNEVASLTPDQGDKTKAAANTAALKDARAKIKVGTQDAQAARKDITTIMNALKSFNLSASATGTTSVTTQ